MAMVARVVSWELSQVNAIPKAETVLRSRAEIDLN